MKSYHWERVLKGIEDFYLCSILPLRLFLSQSLQPGEIVSGSVHDVKITKISAAHTHQNDLSCVVLILLTFCLI